MSNALDNARAALTWINRMHPESTIQVGSETHGGPPQYGQGCIHHGAYCPWLGERKVLEALIAENERLTATPTVRERPDLVMPIYEEGETWVCAKCGGTAWSHGLPTSACLWEPVAPDRVETVAAAIFEAKNRGQKWDDIVHEGRKNNWREIAWAAMEAMRSEQ